MRVNNPLKASQGRRLCARWVGRLKGRHLKFAVVAITRYVKIGEVGAVPVACGKRGHKGVEAAKKIWVIPIGDVGVLGAVSICVAPPT